MNWPLLYAAGASAFILWAIRRLYLAWTQHYVVEVDDPEFGFEEKQIHRAERPTRFWFSFGITAFLLVVMLVVLYFATIDLMSGITRANV